MNKQMNRSKSRRKAASRISADRMVELGSAALARHQRRQRLSTFTYVSLRIIGLVLIAALGTAYYFAKVQRNPIQWQHYLDRLEMNIFTTEQNSDTPSTEEEPQGE